MTSVSLLLCAATSRELASLAPHFSPPEDDGQKNPWPEMHLWPLRLKHGEALCCITGVGPVNAALAMGHALSRAEAEGRAVTAAINAGLAGAFDLATHSLRSLCLVHEEIWPEYGLHDGTQVSAGAFGFPLWQPEQGTAVRDRLFLAAPEEMKYPGIDCKQGVFLSCTSLTVAGVSASFARAAAMRIHFGADLENMEGFAVAYACARQGVPCLEVRSVSNKVGPRARDEKDFPGAHSALAQVLPALNLI